MSAEEVGLRALTQEDVWGAFCKASEYFARSQMGLPHGSQEEADIVQSLASVQFEEFKMGFVERHRDANGEVTNIGDRVEIDGRKGTVLGYTDDGFVVDFGGSIESVSVYGEGA